MTRTVLLVTLLGTLAIPGSSRQLTQEAQPLHLRPPPAAKCAEQNLTSPATPDASQWIGIFGYAVAMAANSRTLIVSAPGEQPDANKTGGPTGFFNSLGNVYFTTAAAPTKAAPSSCTYNRFTALQKPPVANGKAQGFGMAVTLSPDASMIIAGVGGCFVTPGGKAPPCPNFPGGSAAAGGLPNKGDLQGSGGYKGRQASFWLPDQLNMNGSAPTPVDEGANLPNVPIEMDLLWMYNRKQGHTRPHSSSSNSSDASAHSTWSHVPAAPVSYVLDKKASSQLKVSGFVLPKQTTTFFYRTPMEIFPTMSTKGDTIAVVALMGDIGEEQTVQLITSTGVQVFKTNKGGWNKVLNMRNMTDSGQPCSSNVTEPCRLTYVRNAAISPDGRTLATLWGTGFSTDLPLTLHTWTGGKFTLAKIVNFTSSDAPATAPAFSPDSKYMAMGTMVFIKAQKKFMSSILVYSLTYEVPKLSSSSSSSSSSRLPQLKVELLCNMSIPGDVDPLSSAGSVTGISLLYVNKPKSQQALRLAASQSGAPTLIYDMPLLRSAKQSTIACPDPAKPTYSVLPNGAFGDASRTGWGTLGSQAVTATKVLGGQPGGSAAGKPMASGGASLITL